MERDGIQRAQPRADVETAGVASTFELVGIPGGTYRLRVHAKGYSDHVEENITVAPGKKLELGAIYLKPSATLDLEVVDVRGSPIYRFEVSCNGKLLRRDPTKDLGAGKRRYTDLPPESVKITVKSDGYLDQSRELQLQPGQSASVRIVLQARTRSPFIAPTRPRRSA